MSLSDTAEYWNDVKARFKDRETTPEFELACALLDKLRAGAKPSTIAKDIKKYGRAKADNIRLHCHCHQCCNELGMKVTAPSGEVIPPRSGR